MTVQEAIEKSRSKGYESYLFEDGRPIGECIPNILMDSSFWQLLGEKMEWVHTEKRWCELKSPMYSNEQKGREGEIVGETIDESGWWVRWNGIKSRYSYPKECINALERGKDYLEYWHELIDHLAEGKSIEEYFEKL